jgi:hypothetical protein
MGLVRDLFGWLFLAGAIAGLAILAVSYRIRSLGRHENMLFASLRDGCVGGLIAFPIVALLALLVAYFQG